MRIFLIGYMGSGKSTLGRRVASKLGLTFIDMDHYIEHNQGCSIAEIFERKGEDGFRRIEQSLLSDLLEMEDVVVATGGGAPCFFDNMEWINNSALSIFIDPDCDALVSRLVGAKQKRPLIKDMSDSELREFVAESLKKREPFYSQAKIRISGRSISPADVINVIGYSLSEQSREE